MDPEYLKRTEHGRFSLQEFCNDAAKLAKYLIRAREKLKPGFLGAQPAYKSWHLENIKEDLLSPLELLGLARRQYSVIEEHMLSMGASGGVALDDPLGDFKGEVFTLTDDSRLGDAIRAMDCEQEVNWRQVAAWNNLPSIRSTLNKLIVQGYWQTNPAVVQNLKVVANSSRVKLHEWGTKPIATIDETPCQKLTKPQYDVIRALLVAGPKGLHKDDLELKSKHQDARRILGRLRDKEESLWADVIEMAEAAGHGYRIR